MEGTIVATLNIAKASILTIDTADLYLQLNQPAEEIQFNVTYDPNVFAFLPNTVQCALPLTKLDTSKRGVVSFQFASNAPDATANIVRFSFRPLMAVPLAGFIANGLVTTPAATLTVPTVNVSVQRTYIYYIPVNPVNPGPPPVGMPLPVPPFGAPPLDGSPVPPPAPPTGSGDANNAVLGIANAMIYTIQTADLYVKLDKPVTSIEFNVTYDPNVFRFLPGSVQCALPWSNVDTSKPGMVSIKFKSEDDTITATVASFSFAPLMAVPLAGFVANGLVTTPAATLTVPTVNVSVQSTYIHFIPVNPVNPGPPPVGMPLPVPPLGASPLNGSPLLGMPYYIPSLYL